jgi:Protein of unknown function (DUF3500)
LALSITVASEQGVLTPTLTGAQPALYTIDGKTVRPLGQESDKASALLNALDEKQRKQAILSYRLADLVLGPGQDGKTIQPEGLKASAMNERQRAMLVDLISEWAGIIHESAQVAAYSPASRTPIQAFTGMGGFHRNWPSGGAANGTHLNIAPPFKPRPLILPPVTDAVGAAERMQRRRPAAPQTDKRHVVAWIPICLRTGSPDPLARRRSPVRRGPASAANRALETCLLRTPSHSVYSPSWRARWPASPSPYSAWAIASSCAEKSGCKLRR